MEKAWKEMQQRHSLQRDSSLATILLAQYILLEQMDVWPQCLRQVEARRPETLAVRLEVLLPRERMDTVVDMAEVGADTEEAMEDAVVVALVPRLRLVTGDVASVHRHLEVMGEEDMVAEAMEADEDDHIRNLIVMSLPLRAG